MLLNWLLGWNGILLALTVAGTAGAVKMTLDKSTHVDTPLTTQRNAMTGEKEHGLLWWFGLYWAVLAGL